MTTRSEPADPFRAGSSARLRPAVGRAHLFSVLAIAIAALVAASVVVVRNISAAEAVPSLTVQIALPGVGAGAPPDLETLHAARPTGSGVLTPALYFHNPNEAVTAARYAAHLTRDLVQVPEVAAAPLTAPEQIQAAVAFAANPQLVRETVATDDLAGGTVSVLLARLGLSPGDPLPPYFTYEVQRGDTVEGLARRFNVEAETILFNNWEIRDPDRLDPGSELTVPTADGVVYTVRLGDTLFDIIQNFDADMDATLAFDGNALPSPDRLVEGSTILLVGGSASAAGGGGGAGIAAGPVLAIPEFRWPLGGILVDFFGSPRGNRFGFHTGIDVSAPRGTFVGSSAPGTVIQAGWDGSFGLSVLVDHGGGVLTRYAHLDHIDVFLGAFVDAGSLIGFVGSTGYSTGPHLHFEIVMGGVPQDPLVWLN